MSTIKNEGFVYVATGEKYVEEARHAALTLRKYHPETPICLVTDKPTGEAFWKDLVILEKPAYGFRDKMAMWQCPYERFIFLDTDVRVLGKLDDLFTLLRRFDFAGHQLFEGHDCTPPGVPDAFPEFNTGMLAFQRNERTAQLFKLWAEHYERFLAENTGDHYDYSNIGDQKSFRYALYHSSVSLAVVGPEYNFVPHHVNFACAPVRILHARGEKALDDLERRLNKRLGNRVYVPRLNAIVSNDTDFSELCRLWLNTSLQLIRHMAVKITPLRLRNSFRRNRWIRFLFLHSRFGENETPGASKWRMPSR